MKIGEIKVQTADEAAQKLDRYATLFVRVQKAEAMAAKKIADIQAELAEKTKEAKEEMTGIETELAAFCQVNKILFSDKRKLKTKMATLGLQKADKVLIENEEAFIAFAKANGFKDLFKSKDSVVKEAVKIRLKRGEKLPGAKIDDNENINIGISKQLLAEVNAE